MRIVALTLTVLCCAAIFAQQAIDRSPKPAFRAMVKPGGWTIPKKGNVLSRKPFVDLPNHPPIEHLYESAFRTPPDMWLPWYFVEDGRLMLYQYQFRLNSNLLRFDVDGKPFRYIAFCSGKQVGVASTASWTDRDGDGVFEEFEWVAEPYGDLPQWVLTTTAKQSERAR